MNQDYKAIYKNTGMTRRTMHRVEDHYALHTFKSEWDDAKEFFIGAVVVSLFVTMCIGIGYGFMAWLDIAK